MAIRLLWLVLVVLAGVLWVIGTIENSTSIPATCSGGTCDPFALSTGDLIVLADLDLPVRLVAGFFAASNIGLALSFFTIAGAIAWRKSADWMGLLVSFSLVYLGAIFFTDSDDALWRAYPASRTLLTLLGMVGYGAIMLLLFHFPNGQFVPEGRVARIIGWLIILLTTPFVGTATRVGTIGAYPLLVSVGLGLAAQIYRYRQVSGSVQRQQTKWVVVGLATSLIVMVIWVFTAATFPPGPPSIQRVYFLLFIRPLITVLIPLLPLTIAFSILRYRLWDVDVVINRTLLYGTLTACVVFIFVLIVGGLSALFQSQGNPLIALLATGLVAVLFQPLRERLQRAINRLMFGERDEPYKVLRRLGRRLETAGAPETVLPTLVETVAQMLKLPYAEITLSQGDHSETAALIGKAVGKPLRYPLYYQSETIGYLYVSPRSPQETFSKAEERLLRQIARQAGPAAHAVQLTRHLHQSRIRLVTAREEERRRLHRNLHDGLGPVLASQGLKMAAVSQRIQDDPVEAQRLLEELVAQNEATVADIRRLVYDLRPAALDDLGLVGAVRDYAAGLEVSARKTNSLQVDVHAPAPGLSVLPAAIEVAAYRIATEALTNVVRHAQAHHSAVSFVLESISGKRRLRLEITDDGVGLLLDGKTGVGLISMRERAEEVGGNLLIESVPRHGCRVVATLPLVEEE